MSVTYQVRRTMSSILAAAGLDHGPDVERSVLPELSA
jgi:hypothetical protein